MFRIPAAGFSLIGGHAAAGKSVSKEPVHSSPFRVTLGAYHFRVGIAGQTSQQNDTTYPGYRPISRASEANQALSPRSSFPPEITHIKNVTMNGIKTMLQVKCKDFIRGFCVEGAGAIDFNDFNLSY